MGDLGSPSGGARGGAAMLARYVEPFELTDPAQCTRGAYRM
ncbi:MULTISPECIES: hypothetical protein [Sorangium]|uniref:Uncharacterized protein n=1 Tax=Sorangium cellulosum TaxID=56 RepID=A0A4P2QUQ5_SORCE|nr:MULTISPECIES: hypothetical protein [Sorangium]AUX33293.1 uncharacterized protein SOCE836_054480 [Sorangium cellulosum]WCQ92608.1 hypothetical protein NQZ70_05351 [Sorangium sp. Soce836]